ncbi:hypothetical protein AB5J62_29555 [Amycolatopsis sp. cg5]|uniref:hypothetical protein n=1 Tax=Amycolatopsis sp. cg5 TaxID=3238802 RepID=UPI003526908C
MNPQSEQSIGVLLPMDEGIRYRLGFTVDVVAYTGRTIDTQRQIQDRLFSILHRFVAAAGITHEQVNFQPNGDGYHYFLPDSDMYTAVRHLLSTLPRLLTEDNAAHDERIRLRMAVDVGTVGSGPLGFTADAVVRFSRLVDSVPIRAAVVEHCDADLMAIVSETLFLDVVTRFSDLAALPFERVDVAVKGYRAPAYLLVCGLS